MAKKKKKKKPPAGAQRSSYAKGKKVESDNVTSLKRPASSKQPAPAAKGAAGKGTPATKAGAKGEVERPRANQWNLVVRGSLELKVFLSLLAIIIVVAIMQYPLAIQDATTSYNKLKKQYPAELKKFEEKYKTAAQQKAHTKEKPVVPKKPTFQDFLIYQALFLVVQGALFSFIALNVQRRTDLKTPIFDKANTKELKSEDVRDLLTWSIPFAALALIPPVISTLVGKSLGFIKAADFKATSAWKFSLSYINIVINNEILFTFLVLSTLVYIFVKYHDRIKLEPHWLAIAGAVILQFGYIYWVGVGAGEKHVTALIGAIFLAITISGILGYLYWRKGLEYSLLAGVIAFGIYPFVARLIIK